MENENEFDQFLLKLNASMQKQPTKKYRVILEALRNSDCPYIKEKIKGFR